MFWRGFWVAAIASVRILYSHPEEVSKNWWSATEAQILEAPCVNWRAPSTKELWKFVDDNFSYEAERDAWNQILPHFAHFNSKIRRPREDLRKLLDTAFDERRAALLMVIHLQFGFNASDSAEPNDSSLRSAYKKYRKANFSENDLEALLLAFRSMPKTFYAPQKNFVLIRVSSISDPFDKVLANALLVFSDTWSYSTISYKIYTVIHELAHRLDRLTTLERKWLALSEWEKSDDPQVGLIPKNEGAMVSEYSKKNPAEDWAESASAYRFNPRKLMGASPEKYEWIKWQVFGGVEFTSKASCAETPVCSYFDSPTTTPDQLNTCGAHALIGALDSQVGEKVFYKCLDQERIKATIRRRVPGEYAKQAIETCSVNYPSPMVEPFVNDELRGLAEEKTREMVQVFENVCESNIKFSPDCGSVDLVPYSIAKEVKNLSYDLEGEYRRIFHRNRDLLTKACMDICIAQRK